MSVWFTADHHWGHKSIIVYAGRPFLGVEEMDAALIRKWNERVGERDEVYHLGDIIFRSSRERSEAILSQLRGRIYLVRGNHDRDIAKHKAHFAWIRDLAEVKIQDADAPDGVQRIVLCHYAMRVWPRSHYGAWSLYGHSHGSLPDNPNALSLDVGVDCHGYAPVSYEDVRARMRLKRYVPVDHHGSREGCP